MKENETDGKKSYYLEIINRNHHIGTEKYIAEWTLLSNGKKIKEGKSALPEIAPGETGEMILPAFNIKDDSDVRLNVSIKLKNNETWAKAGYEIAWEQFAINDNMMAVVKNNRPSDKASKKNLNDIIKSEGFQAFRAPTDNDRSFGNWLAKDWRNQKLDTPEIIEIMAEKVISDDNNGYKTVKTESIKEYRYANGSIKVKTLKTVYPDGTTDIEQIYSPQGELPELPRLCAVFTIDGNYSNLSWYGSGPGAGSPDRKTSLRLGRWASTVTEPNTPHLRPQRPVQPS